VWGAPGKTAYLILIGLNIEICFMFLISGIVWSKMLPRDKRLKIAGIPNRLVFAVAGAVFCVFVEVLLNALGVLTWEYSWWDANSPWLIFLIGYLTFFLVAFWVYDMKCIKEKALAVGVILGVDVVALVVFMGILNWI